MLFSIDELITKTEKWLTTGSLDVEILAEEFNFISPYWKSSNKQDFVDKFSGTEYIEKSLSNILKFDPVIRLKSDDGRYFTIVLQYHTKYHVSVYEAVLGKIQKGLLIELRSIYDLEQTKLAHRLA